MTSLLSPSDRPDPPVLLQITDPKRRAVTLSWTPGDDHNSPVLGLDKHTHTDSYTFAHTSFSYFSSVTYAMLKLL